MCTRFLEQLTKYLFKASCYKHKEINICISFLAILSRVLVCLKCLSMVFPHRFFKDRACGFIIEGSQLLFLINGRYR